MRVETNVRLPVERHVRFHPVVQVRIYDQQDPIDLRPTLEALRLERQIRNMPLAEARVVNEVEVERRSSKATNCYKNTCHIISVASGIMILPSFVCISIGPIGLVVPAGLLAICIIANVIGGRETEEFRAYIDNATADIESHDYR